MVELQKKGLVKNLGVANFNVTILRDLLNSSKVKPVLNQFEFHPLNTQKTLVKFCKSKNIQVGAYSSFGGTGYIK
jgi:diketogulonate reductase-like aldo/keto reductase